MGGIAWRKLGLTVVAAGLLVLAAALPATAQNPAAPGLQNLPNPPGLQNLPDVSQAPLVGNLVDEVEAGTGVDLPIDQEPAPPPAATPAPSPSPSGGGQPASPSPSGGGSAPRGSSAPASRPSGSSAVSNTASTGSQQGDPARDSGPDAAERSRPRERKRGTADRDLEPRAGERERESSPLGSFISGIEELPWTVFAAILILAAIGLTMAGRSAVLAVHGRRLRAQGQVLREDVGALQSALLPEIPERIGDVALSVAYRPNDGPAAGGDFHDVVELADGRLALVVGDISGHGREALTVTALAHYTLRAYLEAGLEPREALRLAEDAVGGKLGENFVTVIAATYDPAASRLVLAAAGHPAPIFLGAVDSREVEALTAPPIGIGPRTGYRQTEVSLPRHSRVLLFTDGLVEARTAPGELLDREGLRELAAGLELEARAGELLERLAADAEICDDATAFLIRPLEARGDGTVVEELDLAELGGLDAKLAQFLAQCGLEPEQAEFALAEIGRSSAAGQAGRLRISRAPWGVQWKLVEPAPRVSTGLEPPGAADSRSAAPVRARA